MSSDLLHPAEGSQTGRFLAAQIADVEEAFLIAVGESDDNGGSWEQ